MTTNKQYDLSYTAGALISDYFDAVMNEINDLDLFKLGEEVIHHSVVAANAESSQKRYLLEINKRYSSLLSSEKSDGVCSNGFIKQR